MVQCGACSTENTPDSWFCKNCGNQIGANVPQAPPGAAPPPKDIAQQITDAGKRFREEIG